MKKIFFSLFEGFSLIELLISLTVISLIIASFAPVFSRKIKSQSLTAGGSQKITNECSSINSDCKICDMGKNICLYCQGTCNAGYKYNTSTCKCEKLICSSGQYLDGSNCLSCATKFENCKTCSISECTKCESGWGVKNGYCKKAVKPKSQSDCNQFKGAIFVKTNTDGTGVCFTKQNAGDKEGPSADYPDMIEFRVAAPPKNILYNGNNKRCWTGAQSTYTAAPKSGDTYYCREGSVTDVSYSKTNGAKFDYGACYRTVCNFDAAKYICENYKTENTKAGDWRLPNTNEFAVLSDIVNNKEPSKDGKTGSEKFSANTSTSTIQKYMGSKGLQLCDETGGYGSPPCRRYKNKCPGASGIGDEESSCIPAGVWGTNSTKPDEAKILHLNKGKLEYDGYITVDSKGYGFTSLCIFGGSCISSLSGAALSVRCVLEEFLED